MDKNTIKARLAKRFLSEEGVPGILLQKKHLKDSGKENKAGVAAIEKDVKNYDKGIKDKNMNQMAPNKANYTDDFQETYHDEMEILNGQEMLQYDLKPSEQFVERAKEGIEGSSKMGNQGKIGNAEETWGASKDSFGKDLVKRIKSSTKKRSDETPTLNLRGRDIQADVKDTGHKPYAIEENKDNKKTQIKESMKRLKFKNPFNGLGNALKLIPEGYKVDKKEFEMTDGNESYKIRWEGPLTEGKAIVLTAADKKHINEDITRMKELFNYKSEKTLGTVKGNARIDENKVFADIWNKSKRLVEGEDMMETEAPTPKKGEWEEAKKKQAPEAKKHIDFSMTGKESSTAKPKEGHWEDVAGGEKMMEIEAPEAKEGDLDKAVKQAPEAKKHIQGSVSTDKGTQAPKPKEGHWEDTKVAQAPEAKKHVTLKETKKVDPKKALKEEEEETEVEEPETEINPALGGAEEEGPEPDDDSNIMTRDAEPDAEEKEPTAKDLGNGGGVEDVTAPAPIKGKVSLLFSQGTGQYWINNNGSQFQVPDEYMHIASMKGKKGSEKAAMIIQKMEAEVPEVGGLEDEL